MQKEELTRKLEFIELYRKKGDMQALSKTLGVSKGTVENVLLHGHYSTMTHISVVEVAYNLAQMRQKAQQAVESQKKEIETFNEQIAKDFKTFVQDFAKINDIEALQSLIV